MLPAMLLLGGMRLHTSQPVPTNRQEEEGALLWVPCCCWVWSGSLDSLPSLYWPPNREADTLARLLSPGGNRGGTLCSASGGPAAGDTGGR